MSEIELVNHIAPSAGAVEYTDRTSAEGKDPSPNECPEYDTKQSDCGVPVMLGLWGMRDTSSLLLLPGPVWPGMVAPIYGLNRINCILMLNWIVWIRTVWLNGIAWNRNVFDNSTVFTFKLRTYAKPNRLKWNSFWH